MYGYGKRCERRAGINGKRRRKRKTNEREERGGRVRTMHIYVVRGRWIVEVEEKKC